MKFKRNLTAFLLLTAIFFTAHAQTPAGTELCAALYDALREFRAGLAVQPLTSGGQNDFPYNLVLDFPAENGSENTLVLILTAENAWQNLPLVKALLRTLRDRHADFNTTVLIAYGENPPVRLPDTVSGSRVFLDSLRANENHTAVSLAFAQETGRIITGSMGTVSPTWLVQDVFAALKAAGIRKIPRFYLSQLYRYRFFSEPLLEACFLSDIPAVSVRLSEADEQQAQTFVTALLEGFSRHQDLGWDTHGMMVTVLGRQLWLSEFSILRIIIYLVFFNLLFLAGVVFVNHQLQLYAWSKIRDCWYVIPIVFFITLASFYAGKLALALIGRTADNVSNAFSLLTVQVMVTFTFQSVFFLLEIRFNRRYIIRSIDFLILILAFCNQFIFSVADISLFPVFLSVYLLALLSLAIRNNTAHALLLAAMVLPFLPYFVRLLSDADFDSLTRFLFTSRLLPLFFALLLVPLFLLLFRVLTAVADHWQLRTAVAVSVVLNLLVAALLGATGIALTGRYRAEHPRALITEETYEDYETRITCSDEFVFDEIIRTVRIDLGEEKALLCRVEVFGEDGLPVLYSDNDYNITGSQSVAFVIPQDPPQQLTFSYGAGKGAGRILVTKLCGEDGTYIRKRKSAEIGGGR